MRYILNGFLYCLSVIFWLAYSPAGYLILPFALTCAYFVSAEILRKRNAFSIPKCILHAFTKAAIALQVSAWIAVFLAVFGAPHLEKRDPQELYGFLSIPEGILMVFLLVLCAVFKAPL